MTDGAGAHNYTYDDVGNRTASHQGSSYTYQPFNRLIAANGSSFGYDTNGNLTTKTDASGSWTYAWDYENRLKQASKSGGVTVSYAYDALGRRVQRTSTTGGTTKFVYDGADVIRDLDSAGSIVAEYLNGPGIDNKLREIVVGTASYFLQDHLATTRAFTDTGGNVESSLTCDSFGNVTTGSAATRYIYTGREADSDTGMMFYRAHWYDAHQGRFIGQDPVGLRAGINLYSYVKNDPTRFKDPMGENPIAIVGGIVIVEALLHSYLSSRAQRFFPNADDPHGHKKHCYINCMSLRIHGGIPIWPTIISVGQEVPTILIQGVFEGNLRSELMESAGDLAADVFGQGSAFVIWKSCKELCTQCP